MIHAIIRARNAERYIETCLNTLNKQTEEWRGVLILDAPQDETTKKARIFIDNKNMPVEIILHEKRKGLGYNLWYGIDYIRNAQPEDIVAIVDGDDWLEETAFNTVINAYKKHPTALLTYGSYIKESKGRITRVSKRTAEEPIRQTKWATSHLKTFKYELWQHFPKEYLQHEGKWAEAASDRGLMYGLVELAGIENCIHIKRPIYHWRDSTPQKTEVELQKKWEKIFRKKKPLSDEEFLYKKYCKDVSREPGSAIVEFYPEGIDLETEIQLREVACPIDKKEEVKMDEEVFNRPLESCVTNEEKGGTSTSECKGSSGFEGAGKPFNSVVQGLSNNPAPLFEDKKTEEQKNE